MNKLYRYTFKTKTGHVIVDAESMKVAKIIAGGGWLSCIKMEPIKGK